ncbi:DUF423 domain-containing protein [Iodidimonas nitroreducens]|uniref:DUF423 domain-containing protein n=1 Tax=Iodidimonas nitroreducens TaxID=1236968 RepID=A0A5A7N8F7_9PROT|nr:DUF423 domain-containing protein [Iodidimonas nitroreducens]GAK33622.1 hypothetical protein AQ1_01512 [alpha proteobacterium Q-1]GER03680.1 DUF423 domain-containing protein [Iodidimonas nitroreducens]
MNILIALAGVNGLMAVAALAAGAHILAARLDEQRLGWFTQAAQFQLIHGVALLALGIAALSIKTMPLIPATGMLWQAGVLLFCGSLYWLAFMGSGSLGVFHWLTPLGGLCLMAGWALLIVAGIRAPAL